MRRVWRIPPKPTLYLFCPDPQGARVVQPMHQRSPLGCCGKRQRFRPKAMTPFRSVVTRGRRPGLGRLETPLFGGFDVLLSAP